MDGSEVDEDVAEDPSSSVSRMSFSAALYNDTLLNAAVVAPAVVVAVVVDPPTVVSVLPLAASSSSFPLPFPDTASDPPESNGTSMAATARSTTGASCTRLNPSDKYSLGMGRSASFGRDNMNLRAHGVVSDMVVGRLKLTLVLVLTLVLGLILGLLLITLDLGVLVRTRMGRVAMFVPLAVTLFMVSTAVAAATAAELALALLLLALLLLEGVDLIGARGDGVVIVVVALVTRVSAWEVDSLNGSDRCLVVTELPRFLLLFSLVLIGTCVCDAFSEAVDGSC